MKSVVLNSSGGGSDFGSSGNGLVEKNITLEISKKIKDILDEFGVDVYLVRDKDETISYDDRIKKIKEKYPNKDAIIVSNTLNTGTDKGIEIIYSINDKDTLASNISDNLSYFNDVKYYQRRYPTDTSKDYYYITRNTEGYETIIVRYGYVENEDDVSVIKENEDDLAEAVADAILDYLGVDVTNSSDTNYYIVKSGD